MKPAGVGPVTRPGRVQGSAFTIPVHFHSLAINEWKAAASGNDVKLPIGINLDRGNFILLHRSISPGIHRPDGALAMSSWRRKPPVSACRVIVAVAMARIYRSRAWVTCHAKHFANVEGMPCTCLVVHARMPPSSFAPAAPLHIVTNFVPAGFPR